VIAPSFGDIFFNNSFQNGLLPIVLPIETVEALRAALEEKPGAQVAIDLVEQQVIAPDGTPHRFEIDPYRKECLLAGTDEIGYTLDQDEKITAFEKKYERGMPWL